MKKKLEAELISLAHRILQLKNKEDIAVLQEEARKLYEKLSVLRFVEENFGDQKPTIGQAEVEQKIESAFADEPKEEKVVVGEIPSAEELEDMPTPESVSQLVGNLAASKSVTDEPLAEEDKKEPEVASEEESEVHAEAETEVSSNENQSEEASGEIESEEKSFEETADEPKSEQVSAESEEVKSEEVKSEEEKSEEIASEQKSEENPTEKIESPTFEEGKEFVPVEASEELKFAQEAQKAEEMFWESKPEEMPAAETNTEAPEKSDQDDIFSPKFELSFEDKQQEKTSEDTPAPTFTFDDLLGKDYADPVFVTPEELKNSYETPKPVEPEAPKFEETKSQEPTEVIPITRSFDKINVIPLNKDERGITLNDKLSKGITIGLNDRIAFMKHLFNNSSEDYNRVLSQLITFDNFTDAKDFIDTMVKPDYENWKGKEEYEQRFLEIVEKRFQ
ncbi:hypothetical protein [Flavobacterium sp.]|uniref:hypothetical protein n=1 Tax=Flavobacterium sp. TaxID=239 RepID=UPI0012218919|nr:hypothetical protein [Flavobacterium sp.]RZJ73810.1 MAG: hypothetical protein EOO49_00180 [Flavobacterium sp.]